VDLAYALVFLYIGKCWNKINDLPLKVQYFLDAFSDVIPKYIPYRLLSMGDIQHYIHLIQGVMLPNKIAYQMSPIEHEELQR
jgi:hypothetical protein